MLEFPRPAILKSELITQLQVCKWLTLLVYYLFIVLDEKWHNLALQNDPQKLRM